MKAKRRGLPNVGLPIILIIVVLVMGLVYYAAYRRNEQIAEAHLQTQAYQFRLTAEATLDR